MIGQQLRFVCNSIKQQPTLFHQTGSSLSLAADASGGAAEPPKPVAPCPPLKPACAAATICFSSNKPLTHKYMSWKRIPDMSCASGLSENVSYSVTLIVSTVIASILSSCSVRRGFPSLLPPRARFSDHSGAVRATVAAYGAPPPATLNISIVVPVQRTTRVP